AVYDKLAVPIQLARNVGGLRPGIEDHHADIADRDHKFRNRLDGREQPIDIPGTFKHDLQLAAAVAARFEESFRFLEVVVERIEVLPIGADLGRDNFTGWQRRAVVHGDDSHQILISGKHHRDKSVALDDRLLHAVENGLFLATERVAVDLLL